MAITPRGMEPANIKKRLDTLFPKLIEAYPDKVIRSLARDHKKWAETVTELYRALGYPDSESFLKAYGYTVERAASTGRPSNDHMAVIEELKKRYPNGAPFAKIGELQEANPDLANKFKTLANKSKDLFGMSLADYFKSIGLLGGSDHKKQLDELLTELKRRYPAGTAQPATLAELKENNADLMVHRLSYTKEVYGVNPQEYLVNAGLIKDVDPASELMSFVATIKERYAGKLMPGSLDQLKTENGDLPFASAAKWVQEIHGMSLVQYLKKEKIIDLESRQLQAAEKVVANKPTADTLEFAGRAFVTTGLDDSQERRVKNIVQSRGGFFRTAVSKNTDYLITHPSIPQRDITKKYQTAKEWIAKGINIQIIPYSRFLNFADRYTQSPTDSPDFLITKGVLTRFMGSVECDGSITIPDGVTEIGSKAFAGYQGIKEIRLNRNIKKINRYAFKDCTFLKRVSIDGNDWSNVDIQAFSQYASLSITFVGMPEFYISKGTLLRYFGTSALVDIPDEVLAIGDSAFKNNTHVEIIRLNNHITSIGDEAFANCQKLRTVTLPNAISEVGKMAFSNCGSLKNVNLPNKLAVLGEAAFEECIALEEIAFPDKLTAIPASVCSGCHALSQVKLGKKVSKIEEYAFSRCFGLAAIDMPDNLRQINNGAFKECRSLQNIKIPSKVRKITEEAFMSCSALQRVEFSEELTTIGWRSFMLCTSLKEVIFYEGLKSIGEEAFSGCRSLKEESFHVRAPKKEVC